DQFRGRLMFPIAEVSGEVIGFGARALGAEQPKYLNSPETPIYHKARVLYGLDQSRRGIAKDGVAVVTEGYTDVIGLHKAGVETAVATCGTALGDDHLGLLKRFCDRAILAFDADAAGAVASERAFGQHHELGLEVLVAPLPAGKDPADVALTEGAEAVEAILAAAVPLMRFVLEAEIARHRVDTPEGKGRAVRAAAQLLSWEPSRVARGEHAFWVARQIGVEESSVQREISEAAAPAPRREAPATSRQPGHVKVEREALALVLNEPGIVAASDLTEEHFTLQENRSILQAIREANGADAAAIMDRLPDDTTRRLAAELALTTPVTQDPQEVFVRLEEFRLRRKISDLRTTLERLDPSSGDYRERFEELIRIEDLRRQLEIR
ncbi:MAG: DNA primase, partial [Actinomycetota bacterium]